MSISLSFECENFACNFPPHELRSRSRVDSTSRTPTERPEMPRPTRSQTRHHQNLSFILDATVLKLPYTFPGGLPRIKLTTASRAMWMFLNPPRIWIFESASTILVFDAFSIANFVFPSFPAILPIALPKSEVLLTE